MSKTWTFVKLKFSKNSQQQVLFDNDIFHNHLFCQLYCGFVVNATSPLSIRLSLETVSHIIAYSPMQGQKRIMLSNRSFAKRKQYLEVLFENLTVTSKNTTMTASNISDTTHKGSE